MGLGKKQELSSGKAKGSKHKVFLHFSRQKAGEGRRKRPRPPAKEAAGDLNIHLAQSSLDLSHQRHRNSSKATL